MIPAIVQMKGTKVSVFGISNGGSWTIRRREECADKACEVVAFFPPRVKIKDNVKAIANHVATLSLSLWGDLFMDITALLFFAWSSY